MWGFIPCRQPATSPASSRSRSWSPNRTSLTRGSRSAMKYAWAGADNGFIELTDCFSYAGVKGRTSKGPMDLPQVDHFATEMDDFADCIMNNKPTRAPGEMGVEDVRTMTAIYESIAQGKM